jgi:phytoene dehydrogenase-like protein
MDAAIVGSGPNGLAAGIVLAQANYSTTIYESANLIGGGCRSSPLTLPGYLHDVCSAVHPLAAASPFFQNLPLEKFGLEWITPEAALANPFDDGTCALLHNSLSTTVKGFENSQDSMRYVKLLANPLANIRKLFIDILGPLRFPHSNPILLSSFVRNALKPVHSFVRDNFQGKDVKALFGGLAAHSMLQLEDSLTTGFALLFLLLAHSVGWPFPRGGSQRLVNALGDYFTSLGGRIITNFEVKSLADLPPRKVTLFDVTPKQLLRICSEVSFPSSYSETLRSFKYGPGIFKLDYALRSPVPWKSAECSRASTVHVCGELDEIAFSEQIVSSGGMQEKPFVIVVQPSLFDPTRAPDGNHTLWAYCHVASGSDLDMSDRIENQIERFAPGFKSTIIARHSFTAVEIENYNSNYVGGDINGGLQDIWQTLARPTLSLNPYKTPMKGVYICSSSTPPGGGVHGMCGYFAAKSAIKRELRH